ncbi:hypothetical protein HDU82_003770 [Entophlyctis luteolus]|nr:hypothetical protein HDU82_003770 [Entophlyctis luteolus]
MSVVDSMPRQSHTARNLSAAVFVALLATFARLLLLFVLDRLSGSSPGLDGDTPNAKVPIFGVALALLLSLYLALVPAAALHGAIVASSASIREGLSVVFALERTPGQAADPVVEGADAPESSAQLVHAATVHVLRVVLAPPAAAHAVAHVCTRAALHTVSITTRIIATEVLPALCRAVLEAGHRISVFADGRILPALHSFLAVALPRIADAVPAACEATWNATMAAWNLIINAVLRVCVFAGQVVHDSWDPCIVPVLLRAVAIVENAQASAVIAAKKTFEVCTIVLSRAHDALALAVEYAIGFCGFWWPILTPPLFSAILSFWCYTSLCLKTLGSILDESLKMIWNVAEECCSLLVRYQVLNLIANLFSALLATLNALFKLATFLAHGCHWMLGNLFSTVVPAFASLAQRFFDVSSKMLKILVPHVLTASHFLYVGAQNVLSVTKRMALPLIHTLNMKLHLIIEWTALAVNLVELQILWHNGVSWAVAASADVWERSRASGEEFAVAVMGAVKFLIFSLELRFKVARQETSAVAKKDDNTQSVKC